METVEDRVDTIEEIMKQLSLAQLNTEKELTRLSNSIEEGHRHTMQMFEESRRHTMQMFEESRRHTMQMFEESRQLTEMELQSLSQEMKEFKDEMKEFKDEMIKDRKKIDKQWGDLANKMGTVVEDIVAPNRCDLSEIFQFRSKLHNDWCKTKIC